MERITSHQVVSLMEAYSAVYAPQELTEEQVWEEVETWVNSLIEEGYDLSEYTWEEMYESYIEEQGRAGMTSGASDPAVKARWSQIGTALSGGNRTMPERGARPTNVRGGSPAPTAAKPTPTTSSKPQFGTTTPRGSSVTSTGVSGLSAANRAAYSAGGGNVAAQKGMGQTTAQVIAQGKSNLNRMDQGRPAPAARPAAPAPAAARPAAPAPAAARPATAPTAAKPTTPATPYAGATGVKPVGTSFTAPAKPQSDVGGMITRSQQRQAAQTPKPAAPAPARPMGGGRERMLRQSFDVFDVIKGHLIDEGYADTEEAALQIMANMSEEWKNSIIG